MRATATAVLLVAAAVLAGCASEPTPPTSTSRAALGGPAVALERIADGLSQPVFATAWPLDDRLAVVEQVGRVLLLDAATGARTTLLDVQAVVAAGGELGLLGLAFHPDFAAGDRRLYVHYTDAGEDTQLDEYLVIDAAADPPSLLKSRSLLHVEQPYSNHNGGMLAFGPDGMLYMGLGDGGYRDDPHGNGQSLETLLGKILRLDVGTPEDAQRGRPYGIPADNPFAGGGGRGEVWDYGLRNPWRFSFDRATGELWIGDVGQDHWEEVDREAPGRGGINYGWAKWEGKHLFESDGDAPGHVLPIVEYSHAGGRCSVTGGYVYRGEDIPAMEGAYLYADYCSGTMWALVAEGDAWTPRVLLETGMRVSSFGEDAGGELYVMDHEGAIHRIVAA